MGARPRASRRVSIVAVFPFLAPIHHRDWTRSVSVVTPTWSACLPAAIAVPAPFGTTMPTQQYAPSVVPSSTRPSPFFRQYPNTRLHGTLLFFQIQPSNLSGIPIGSWPGKERKPGTGRIPQRCTSSSIHWQIYFPSQHWLPGPLLCSLRLWLRGTFGGEGKQSL